MEVVVVGVKGLGAPEAMVMVVMAMMKRIWGAMRMLEMMIKGLEMAMEDIDL